MGISGKERLPLFRVWVKDESISKYNNGDCTLQEIWGIPDSHCPYIGVPRLSHVIAIMNPSSRGPASRLVSYSLAFLNIILGYIGDNGKIKWKLL